MYVQRGRSRGAWGGGGPVPPPPPFFNRRGMLPPPTISQCTGMAIRHLNTQCKLKTFEMWSAALKGVQDWLRMHLCEFCISFLSL